MRHARGALWGKWDLHVHTPASFTHGYGSSSDAAWERFLLELEQLPEPFKVIGINDYIFTAGYRRVCEARRSGRLANIDLVLPVLELRLDKFGGSRHQLSRVNFHVIFSNEVSPEHIDAQFLAALGPEYQLSPKWAARKVRWSGVPTPEALAELGDRIIETVPETKRPDFGSPTQEGFNALCLPLESIQKVLDRPYFRGKHLTAIGKTEWGSVAWNDQSVAEKKHLINSVDIVFTSAVDISTANASRDKLEAEGVNFHLLDCSDAHHFADSQEKDRLGKCFSWIKADTEFVGLRHALHEYEDRVYLGEEPPSRARLRTHSALFLDTLQISKGEASALDEPWFDGTRLQFGPGLVAVIGCKGSGKSALLDIVAALSDSSRATGANLSFLNRFNQAPQRRGRAFEARLTWASTESTSKTLDEPPNPQGPERVRYVPQALFERICNELGSGERGAFTAELESVIFSHVALEERLGHTDLSSLIGYKIEPIQSRLADLRKGLAALNRRIVALEDQTRPEHRGELTGLARRVLEELRALRHSRPETVFQPDSTSAAAQAIVAKIAENQQQQSGLRKQLAEAQQQQELEARRLAHADRLLAQVENLRRAFEEFKRDAQVDAQALGLRLDELATLTVDSQSVRSRREAIVQARASFATLLAPSNTEGPVGRLTTLEHEVVDLRVQLDEPSRRYQKYLQEERDWQARRRALIGDPAKPGASSLLGARQQIQALTDIPSRLASARADRLEASRSILRELLGVCDVFRSLYRPVQEFINSNDLARERLRLEFEVSLVPAKFTEGFLDWIHQGVTGSFFGAAEGAERVREILSEHSFDDETDVARFLGTMDAQLHADHRPGSKGAPLGVRDQLRDRRAIDDLYNYLYGLTYLEPRYQLRLGGRTIDQLSPGERGALLLVFFLLVDRHEGPLLVDQPEENLDNETVYRLLVPSLRRAKTRRQILMVTHNPNLAVVCDAEQVIRATRDPKGFSITYTSGAIENPEFNEAALNVLEGTRPAFEDRRKKYHATEV